ncbi:MAG: A24 family peptidase [Neomegalonema sp.]|nr:A24 family peptidase [Neomegalonema sp.]
MAVLLTALLGALSSLLLHGSDMRGVMMGGLLAGLLASASLQDWRRRLVSDVTSFALIGFGLLNAALVSRPMVLEHGAAALGAGVGLWSVDRLYQAIRGRAGIGGADMLIFAAAGAWLGPSALPWVMVLAAGGAIVVVVLLDLGIAKDRTLPFVPALALALWTLWLWDPPPIPV